MGTPRGLFAACGFDRAITVFRREAGAWRRSDEHHRNVTFDVDEALRVLRENGVEPQVRASFGTEELPDGLAVLAGVLVKSREDART